MKIAILGAGNIGATLGKHWARVGHQVCFGVRDLANPDLKSLLDALAPAVSAAVAPEAIAFGEVIVLAVPGGVVEGLVKENAPRLAGKLVIDAANNMRAASMNSSAAFAAFAPSAIYYRAFNNLGWEVFEAPQFDGQPADLLYCGPAGDSQAQVEQLIAAVGLRPVRVGGLDQIHLVDLLAQLWFALALGQGMGRQTAFKVLRRV